MITLISFQSVFSAFSLRRSCMLPAIQGKVKVQFTLEQAMKAQWGSRGIALLFL
jgi:hypothetical protein